MAEQKRSAVLLPLKELTTQPAFVRLFGSSTKPTDVATALGKRDWDSVKELLAFLRETNLQRPDLVVPLGVKLLERKGSSLGDEVWALHEQIAVAALDLGDFVVAKNSIDQLLKKFPKSHRVFRLKGMFHEAKGKWDKAEEVYQQLIEHDPSDTFAAKRRVCILKAQGRIGQAIEALNTYLETFQADEVAWHELADLYMSQQSFKLASYCFEELILAHPQNYHLYCRYGELLYSIGGQNPKHNLSLAKKYFSYSLKLSPDRNLRSLYGLVLCVQAARAKKIVLTQSSGDDEKLLAWAKSKILATYQSQNPGLRPTVSLFVDSQKAST